MSIFDIAVDHERERNPYGLTPREREIAALVARGVTTVQASEQLELSLNAVETHRTNIMIKLGARNAAHLVHLVGTLESLGLPQVASMDLIRDFRDDFGASHATA